MRRRQSQKLIRTRLGVDEIYKKGVFSSRDFSYKILGLFGGFFSRDLGGFEVEGSISKIGRDSAGGFEAHLDTPVPYASYSQSLITMGRFSKGFRSLNCLT